MTKNILILIAFICVVFFPCLNADFINLDDDGSILHNPALHGLSQGSLKHIFTQTLYGNYVPLTTLSFAIEKRFFGFNPFVFHLDNLLLYIGVAVLMLLLAKRMGLSLGASFLAALIFAIHPMKVESVAWVTERKDALYALFYLAALHQYWSYLTVRSIRYYWAMLFLGLLSVLAKPMALSLPFVLLIFDWFYGRRKSRWILIDKIPILFYVIIIAQISFALNMKNLVGHNTISQGVLIWIWSLVFYLWKFFFPFSDYLYYVLPHPINIFYWPYFLSLGFFLGLIFLLVRFYNNKLFVFAFLYFFCSIFFLIHTSESHFTLVSDRFMFLPSLGICFFLGSWIDQRINSRQGVIIFYVFLVLMGIRTNLQCQIWHNSLSFWNEFIQEYPNYYFPYNNRGTVEPDDLALIDYNRAIALNPRAAKTYNNRGIIYYLKKEDDKAWDDFSKAISIAPNFSEPYLNRSMLKEAQKDYGQALQDALYAKKLGGFVDDGYLQRLQMELSH